MLYVRQNLIEQLEPPFLDQHAATLTSPTTYQIRGDAQRFENWEQYLAGKAALGVAIDYALSYGLEAIQARIYELAQTLRNKLKNIAGVQLTDEGLEKCGIVTFATTQLTPSAIQQRLKAHQVHVSISEGSGSLVSFQHRGLTQVVRASVHYYNTDQEIDYFAELLQTMLSNQP